MNAKKLLEFRHARDMEALKRQRNILKSRSTGIFDVPGVARASLTSTQESNSDLMNTSTGEEDTCAEQDNGSLLDHLTSADAQYAERLAKLQKFKNKSKSITKSNSARSEWMKEHKLLHSTSAHIEADCSSLIEVLLLHAAGTTTVESAPASAPVDEGSDHAIAASDSVTECDWECALSSKRMIQHASASWGFSRGGCVGLDGDVTFGLLAHAARPAHVAYVTLGLQYEYYVWEVAGNFFPAYAVAVHSTFAKREYHRLSRQCRRSAPFGNAGRCEPELEGKTRTLRSSLELFRSRMSRQCNNDTLGPDSFAGEFTKSDCAKVAALFGDRDRSIGQEGASQGWTNVSNFVPPKLRCAPIRTRITTARSSKFWPPQLRATLQNDTACSRTQRTVSNVRY